MKTIPTLIYLVRPIVQFGFNVITQQQKNNN